MSRMTSDLSVAFVTGNHLPFDISPDDVGLSISPHQELPVASRSMGDVIGVHRVLPAGCVVSRHSSPGASSIDGLVPRGSRVPGMWLDSKGLPSVCLASNIARWIQMTQGSPAAMLSLLIREPGEEKSIQEASAWRIDAARTFSPREKNAKSFIWYPALSRSAEFLRAAGNELNPVDIFPLVELPSEEAARGDSLLLRHRNLLQSYRVRTERIIYLPADKPRVAYSVLLGSARALPRAGSAPREGIVTPGLPSFLYMAEVLSAVLSGGALMIPSDEVAPSGAEVEGVAILARRP